MTVCIVRRSWQGDVFVAACDRMLSFGNWITADEMVMKVLPLGPRWRVMYAGDDIGPAADIIATAMARLMMLVDREKRPPEHGDVEREVTWAYQAALRQKIQNEVLTYYGLGLDEYVKEGLPKFGPDEFERINRRIERVALGVELLVFGYGSRSAHIFTVTNPGAVDDKSAIGFWAIGSGSPLALSSLVTSPTPSTLYEVIYNVFDAKFRAEAAIGVGKETILSMLEPSNTFRLVVSRMDDIRKQWIELQPKPTPALLQTIEAAANESKTAEQMTEALQRLKKAPV